LRFRQIALILRNFFPSFRGRQDIRHFKLPSEGYGCVSLEGRNRKTSHVKIARKSDQRNRADEAQAGERKLPAEFASVSAADFFLK